MCRAASRRHPRRGGENQDNVFLHNVMFIGFEIQRRLTIGERHFVNCAHAARLLSAAALAGSVPDRSRLVGGLWFVSDLLERIRHPLMRVDEPGQKHDDINDEPNPDDGDSEREESAQVNHRCFVC